MFSYILLIIYLFNSLNLGVASSSPPNRSPFDWLKKSNNGIIFSAPLIHRTSPESPFFNPNYSREDQIRDGVLTSLARGRFFSRMIETPQDYKAAPVYGGDMLMKYTLGTPPVDIYGHFDTGSSLTWTQCLPCKNCFNLRRFQLFDPKHSSSYQKVVCSDIRKCRMAPGWSCGSSFADDPDLCLYREAYMGNLTTRGVVSTETVTFSAENTDWTKKNIIFGCANDNQGTMAVPGIVGVGNHSISLLHQLSISHFSYYVFASRISTHGVVHFGPGASMSDFGMTTPLLPSNHGYYYLDFLGISVDGSDLDFPVGTFEKGIDVDGTPKGFVIDTGSSYTMLPSKAFDVLRTAIMEAMYESIPESIGYAELCYKDVSGAPEVVFQFRGLDYILCNANLWERQSGLYCLAVFRIPEGRSKLSVLGFYQQRNVQIGYDLEKNLLSLVYPGACPDDDLQW